jgi:transportin-3
MDGPQQLPPHSENVDEELRRIHLALNAVFSPQSQQPSDQWWSQRQQADRYLTSFQNAAVSWMVCDRLLLESDAAASSDKAVQQQRRFFAAQTLHKKCCNDIYELPAEALPQLRDSLLAHLQRYATDSLAPNGHEALTMRLAMCVSVLAVQMGWTTIVNDLLGNPSHLAVATFVLRSLPEECASDRLVLLDDSNRYRMRDHLVSTAPLVFSYFMTNMQERSVPRALKAFHIWIRFVPVHSSSIAETPLLAASIQALTQPTYLEVAADVVVEILRMYPSHHYGNESLVQRMVPALSQLPLDEALRSDDEDVLRAYCRIITEMGESYMSMILSNQYKEAAKLVEWVLRCSGIADPDIAGISLHFWYRMVMDLESIEPFEWRQELVDFYTTYLLKLIDVCVGSLMRYPGDINELSDDRVEDLHNHRFYVSETVEDCCQLLGGHIVLRQVGRLLQEEVEKVAGRQQTEWQGLESCLACLSALHRFVPNDETEFLPFCFNLIPQLPAEIRPLRITACEMIGKFAAFLATHPELLQPLLPYLAQSLCTPETASAAAVAIKELCECSNQNFSIAEPVLQLYEEIAAQPGRLELNDELQILEGVCRALSRSIQDTRSDGKAFLARLAQPVGNRLAAAVADVNSPPARIGAEIDRLTVIVRSLAVPFREPSQHPIVGLLQSSWSLLATSTNRFPGDHVLAERTCRLHKHSLRTCGARAYAPMFDALVQQLVTSFQKSLQSPFLYAASICITEYYKDPAYTQRLFDMVAAMTNTVFSFLRNLTEFTNHPDVVEEFFYLMGRMVAYCPDPVMKSPLLLPLFQGAVVGMQLDHPGASKGTLKFLETTVSHGVQLRQQQTNRESLASLEHVLAQQGQAIVRNLVRALMGDLPVYSNQIPEILFKLNVLAPSQLTQWLTTAFGSAALPERVMKDFICALDTGLARDEFNLAVHAFQSACERERRFRRTR